MTSQTAINRGLQIVGLGVVLSTAACHSPERPTIGLSIRHGSARVADRHLSVTCLANIENNTGRPLTVTSSFFSAFDGLTLLVFDEQDRELARQSFLHHQSPYSITGRPFPIRPGNTEQRMRFPVPSLPNPPSRLVLQLVGTLPGSGHTNRLVSNKIAVNLAAARNND